MTESTLSLTAQRIATESSLPRLDLRPSGNLSCNDGDGVFEVFQPLQDQVKLFAACVSGSIEHPAEPLLEERTKVAFTLWHIVYGFHIAA